MSASDKPTRPTLSIDPGLQFGAVCVTGTRVPADSLSGSVFAGDGVDETASDYGVSRQDVLLACWWLVDQALMVAPSKRKTYEQNVVDRWGKWSQTVIRGLAGHPGSEPPSDPPDQDS
jgi:uncharacterized protein (DUF433 family)